MSFIDDITRATIYDLAQPLEAATPVSPNHPAFRSALLRRHGDVVRLDGGSGANELLSLGTHTGTHIDALCHVAKDGLLYGGFDALEASRGGRFTVHGVDTVRPFHCRGVLLDIARLRGVDALAGGEAVTADDLSRACEREGIAVRPGDAVLIRTGWSGQWANPTIFVGETSGAPGPDASAAHWLADRNVAVTGGETIAYEQIPAGQGHRELPVHLMLIVEHGIHIIEVMKLDELAAAGVHEFAFVAAPLRIVGATGSPIRPLALAAPQ
jgi:kynurenine formamidase